MTNKPCLDPLASAGRLDAKLFIHSSNCMLVVDVGGNVVRLNPGAMEDSGIAMKISGPEDAGLRAKQALNRFNKRKFALYAVQRTRTTKRIVQFVLVVAVGAMSIFSAD